MGLTRFQPTYSFPATGEAQQCDNEHIETSNVCTVIQLYTVYGKCYIMLVMRFRYFAASLCYIKIPCNAKYAQ